MKVLLISVFLIVTVLSQSYWDSVDIGGAQIIDSTLSYANNLRSPLSNNLWLKADKRKPNAYVVLGGTDGKSFVLSRQTGIHNDSLPYFSFDVLTVKGIDYLIGPTYGTLTSNKFGMVLQASTNNRTSTATTGDNFFYTVLVDPQDPGFNSIDYFFYLVGYRYLVGSNTRGIVLSRASVPLSEASPLDFHFDNVENNFYNIDQYCYDIWTETNKPTIYAQIDDNKKYLIVVIPGKCSRIIRIKIPDDTTQHMSECRSAGEIDEKVIRPNCKITSSSYVPSTNMLYFSCKVYNSEESYLYVADAINMTVVRHKDGIKLAANESTPVLTFDNSSGNLFVATSGFNKIYRYDAALNQNGIAVLPSALKAVATMLVNNGFLYLVTYEPNAQVGRIPVVNFCGQYCSDYGYCNGGNGCACIKGYERDTSVVDKNLFVCAPSHIIQYQNTIVAERGAAAAFGILFAVAIIVGVLGWFMWFKRQTYQPINR